MQQRAGLPTLVIGVGNCHRSDDAAGLHAARLVAAKNPPGAKVIEHSGDGMLLISEWKDVQRVIVIDALHVEAAAGKIMRFDAASHPLAIESAHSSTHALSIGDAIEMARALGELPPQIIVYGIVGGNFEMGEDLSASVARAAKKVADRILKELAVEARTHA